MNSRGEFLFMGLNLCHNIALLSRARVVKLVDAGDSKSPAARRAGSIPAPGTSDFLQIAAIFPQTHPVNPANRFARCLHMHWAGAELCWRKAHCNA